MSDYYEGRKYELLIFVQITGISVFHNISRITHRKLPKYRKRITYRQNLRNNKFTNVNTKIVMVVVIIITIQTLQAIGITETYRYGMKLGMVFYLTPVN